MTSLKQMFCKNAPEEIRRQRRLVLVLGCAFLGVVLLLIGGNTAGGDARVESETIYSPQKDEMILYQTYLEERIEGLCRTVKGVGEVTVIVSLSGGFSTVYATEQKEDGDAYVILGSGANAEPLPLSRAAPSIEGIGVVCTGGRDPGVIEALTALLSASFDLSSHRIYITEAK